MFTCCEGWSRGHIPSPAHGDQRTTFQIGSFFPPCGSQVLKPGSQDWPQVFPTRWDISPAPDDMCCCILWHKQSSITFWVMNFSASFWISWSLPHLFILLKEKLEISWLTVSSLFWWLCGGLECMWILDQGVLFRSASEICFWEASQRLSFTVSEGAMPSCQWRGGGTINGSLQLRGLWITTITSKRSITQGEVVANHLTVVANQQLSNWTESLLNRKETRRPCLLLET